MNPKCGVMVYFAQGHRNLAMEDVDISDTIHWQCLETINANKNSTIHSREHTRYNLKQSDQ